MTSKAEPILTLYANLMDEAKVRIDCIDRAVRGQTGFPGPLVREFCYLQLRLLCELIALSCLVAHGDISATYAKRLRREWSADKILDALTKLLPHFYPQAMRQTTQIINGKNIAGMAVIEPTPFPKSDLLELYGNTHKYLHRGNVNKLLNSDTPIEIYTDFPEIIRLAQKINDLLSIHVIVKNKSKLICCILRNAEDNNKVQTSFLVDKLP